MKVDGNSPTFSTQTKFYSDIDDRIDPRRETHSNIPIRLELASRALPSLISKHGTGTPRLTVGLAFEFANLLIQAHNDTVEKTGE